MEEILLAYRERYLALRDDRRIKLIIIFKNHGEAAGTSLEHPHSQLVGTPVAPSNIRRKLEEAARYYDDHGRCVYCDSIQEALNSGTRIVMDTERFVVLQPFASVPLRNLDRSKRTPGLFRVNLHGGFKTIRKGSQDDVI